MVDGLTSPFQRLTRQDGHCVMVVERNAFCQEDSNNRVAIVLNTGQSIHNGFGLGVGFAVPNGRVAERYGACGTQNGLYTQAEVIDAVISGLRLIVVEIVGSSANTLPVEVLFPSPFEIVVFADNGSGVEAIAGFVFGQYQSPCVVAAGLRIECGVLIYAGICQRVGVGGSVFVIEPIIGMRGIQFGVLYMELPRMFDNSDLV